MSHRLQVAIQPRGRTLTRSLLPHSRQYRGASRSARQPTHSRVPQPPQNTFRPEPLSSGVSAGNSIAYTPVLEHAAEGSDWHLQIFKHL